MTWTVLYEIHLYMKSQILPNINVPLDSHLPYAEI